MRKLQLLAAALLGLVILAPSVDAGELVRVLSTKKVAFKKQSSCDSCDAPQDCTSCSDGGCSDGCESCQEECTTCKPDRGSILGNCRKCGGRGNIEGQDLWFNCGCNGSYNFPVPPLSTYHWPGMYRHQLMTDYHSPWRFPPLRPYKDEPDDPADETARGIGSPAKTVRSVSHTLPSRAPARLPLKMSDRMRMLYR